MASELKKRQQKIPEPPPESRPVTEQGRTPKVDIRKQEEVIERSRETIALSDVSLLGQ